MEFIERIEERGIKGSMIGGAKVVMIADFPPDAYAMLTELMEIGDVRSLSELLNSAFALLRFCQQAEAGGEVIASGYEPNLDRTTLFEILNPLVSDFVM